MHFSEMENVSQKNLEHLEQWLSERGLKKYYSVLVQHEVFSVRDLALLTSEDLIEIGIEAVGSRRKLLCHTAQLRSDLGEKARSSSVTSLPPIDQKRTNNVMQEVQLTDEDDTDAPLKEIAQEVQLSWFLFLKKTFLLQGGKLGGKWLTHRIGGKS